MGNILRLLALSALLLSACGGNANPVQPAAAAPEMSQTPRVWIDSPLNGTTLPLGEVEILSHAASLGGIAQVELSVNGAVVRTDPNPSPGETLNLVRQTWLPRAGGTYQVSVRAQNTGGEWSAPASITLTILDATPTSVDTATPAATPTETATSLPSPTATLAGPPVIVLVRNSFCRAGPGEVYRSITALAAGDSAEVRGISQDGFWLFVYWSKFNVECWIGASAAPPGTDLRGAPALTAPPTPTPTPTPSPTIPPTPTSTSTPTPSPTFARPTPPPPTETATPYKP